MACMIKKPVVISKTAIPLPFGQKVIIKTGFFGKRRPAFGFRGNYLQP